MKSIVIGSGFGGIAAALRLKAKGHDVTLVEKHNDLGGRARVFERNGFKFDGGPTVITAPHLIYELFEMFNKDPSNYIKIKPLDVWYRFVFEDGFSFDYSGNENSMRDQIEKISKKDLNGYIKLVDFTKRIFDKGFTELSDVPFDKPLFMMKQLPSLFSLKSYRSVYSLVSSYVENEKLRRMLSMHPLLVGGNPFTTTSIYGLILYLEKKWGIHYSMGGTGAIIKGLEKLMLEEKIEIIKNKDDSTPVFKNSAEATSADAPPPKPLKIATNCGICVISTRIAKNAPMIEPITIAITIHCKSKSVPRNTVATIAISIPKDAIILPFLAVFGWLSIFRPYINDTADSK